MEKSVVFLKRAGVLGVCSLPYLAFSCQEDKVKKEGKDGNEKKEEEVVPSKSSYLSKISKSSENESVSSNGSKKADPKEHTQSQDDHRVTDNIAKEVFRKMYSCFAGFYDDDPTRIITILNDSNSASREKSLATLVSEELEKEEKILKNAEADLFDTDKDYFYGCLFDIYSKEVESCERNFSNILDSKNKLKGALSKNTNSLLCGKSLNTYTEEENFHTFMLLVFKNLKERLEQKLEAEANEEGDIFVTKS